MNSIGISREEALSLLKEHLKNENLIKHSLATEAIMRALAKRLVKDEETWAIAGLLHDLDTDLVNADLKTHGNKTAEILQEKGISPEIINAIKMHNEEAQDRKRSDVFEKALAAGETISGLITATTLVYPDKKLASVKAKSIKKRMKERQFAASVNRDIIRECEDIGIPLDEFIEISLGAMCGIANDLGF
jgi:uncharacterized protein